MTCSDDLPNDPAALELAGRLLRASGRIERSLYERPISPSDAAFLLDWSEALITLAETLVRKPTGEAPDAPPPHPDHG